MLSFNIRYSFFLRILLVIVNVFACILIVIKITKGYNTGKYIDHFIIDNGTIINGTVANPVFVHEFKSGTFFDFWNIIISSVIILIIYFYTSKKWINSITYLFLFAILWLIHFIYSINFFGTIPSDIFRNLILLFPIQLLLYKLLFQKINKWCILQSLFLIGLSIILWHIMDKINTEWEFQHERIGVYDKKSNGYLYGIEFNFYYRESKLAFFDDTIIFFRNFFILVNSLCAFILYGNRKFEK